MTNFLNEEVKQVVKERKEISIYEFLKLTSEEQNEAWYDWFCKDSALPNKTAKLVEKLKQIVLSNKIDITKQYVFFKNNCPMSGNLYDDFRICDMETGDVIYTVIPKSGYRSDEGCASIWGKENDFKGPLVEGSWKDVLAFFGV